jgi:hypothetical protein
MMRLENQQGSNRTTIKYSYLWTYDLYSPVCNAFDAGKSITRATAKWEGEIETFLGPGKWHRAVRRVPFG